MFDIQSLIKYLLEGLAVAVAAYLIPKKSVDPKEIALIALTAAAIFAVLDQFAPAVAIGARQGAGFGIGFSQVGMGYEGFEGQILGYDANGAAVTDPALVSTVVTPTQTGQSLEGFENAILGYDANGVAVTDPALASTIASLNQEGQAEADKYYGKGWDKQTGQGHDEQEHEHEPEGFESTPKSSPLDGICQMTKDMCSYDAKAKMDQKSRYVCSKDGSKCSAVEACQEKDGACNVNSNAKASVGNRVCQMNIVDGKKLCGLNTTEGFEGKDEGNAEDIAGFEGFSKVF